MPMLTELHCAIAIDVLMRISLVLTAGLLLALAARRNAALRHAILLAGLAVAFILPAAMLTMQVLQVSRWRIVLPARAKLDDLAAVDRVSSRAPNEPHHGPVSRDQPAPAIIPARGNEPRLDPHANASAQWSERSPEARALSWLNLPGSLGSPQGRLMASALLSALLFGAIVKVIGLGFSLLRLRRIVARARPAVSDRVPSVLGHILQRIRMRHTPCLLESAEVSAPVAAGVIGNYVLLPAGWARSLCQDEMLAVLCHEAAHLERRDHRVVILQELLASALWFHPLVHLFNRMLNRAREEVCDNHAIAVVDRASYCEALLVLAVGRPAVSPRGATSMWTRDWSLEDRVRGILDEQRPTRTRISRVARTATATFSVAICGLIAMPQLTASQPNDRIATAAEAESSPRAKAGPVANEMTRSIIRSFPVSGERTLRFENLAGRVELVPGNRPTVEVAAIVRVGDMAEEDAKRLIDDIRWVETPAQDGESRWGLAFPGNRYPTVRYPVAGETKTDSTTVRYLGQSIRLSKRRAESIPSIEFDLRISLPPEARIAVFNAVGPIEARHVVARLDLTTHHGLIKLDDVHAPTIATSEFGDVFISRLDADAVVRTGSGGIELSRVARGRVTISTRSGNCRIVQPPDAGFNLQYSGDRPIAVLGDDVKRISTQSTDQRMELLSRGIGGPSITVTGGTGETVIETGS
jgi:beta-lactamase regulating signal transducer with metallopeptidase domain